MKFIREKLKIRTTRPHTEMRRKDTLPLLYATSLLSLTIGGRAQKRTTHATTATAAATTRREPGVEAAHFFQNVFAFEEAVWKTVVAGTMTGAGVVETTCACMLLLFFFFS